MLPSGMKFLQFDTTSSASADSLEAGGAGIDAGSGVMTGESSTLAGDVVRLGDEESVILNGCYQG